MKNLLVLFLSLSFSLLASAKAFDASAAKFQGFIKVSDQHELYVDYVKAKPGQPTVVMINGLTYSTQQWGAMAALLTQKGIGVLLYDMFGQGQTLLKYAPITDIIPYDVQITELKSLLTQMQLTAPYNLIGLSYGGGIAAGYAAAYPGDIKNLILISPYTQPLQTQDSSIQQQIKTYHMAFPFDTVTTDDQLYDMYLRQNVYATYPIYEPVVLENPYKLEATFRLAQGIRKFYPQAIANTVPAGSLHLMIARQDQYIPNDVLDAYWNAVPLASRASRIYVNGSEHKIPEAVPNFAAGWVYNILSGNEIYFQGLDFDGWPVFGEANVGGSKVQVGL